MLKSAYLSAHENTAVLPILNSAKGIKSISVVIPTLQSFHLLGRYCKIANSCKETSKKQRRIKKIMFSRKRIPTKQKLFVFSLKDNLKKLLQNKNLSYLLY